MNPESSSYGETLHEDSFEYNGDMMLMQVEGEWASIDTTGPGINARKQWGVFQFTDGKWVSHGTSYSLKGSEYDSEEDFPMSGTDTTDTTDTGMVWGDPSTGWIDPTLAGMENEVMEGTGGLAEEVRQHIMNQDPYNEKYDLNNDGKVNILDIQEGANTGELTDDQLGDPFEFTRTSDDQFDPTSAEFRQYVETTGGFAGIASGFGQREDEFEEFYGKPLEFWEQEYSTEIDPETGLPKGTLAQQRELDKADIELGREGLTYDAASVAENLRAATESYDVGRRRTGMLAGRSLFDIKQQTEQATAGAGFATQGTVAATGRRAGKGVFQDYALQQRELASQMTGARSAFSIGMGKIGLAEKGFDISEQGIDIDETQAGIDWERKQAGFWKTTEDEFYSTLDYLEELQASDRRLKNNITKIGKSLSGINVYTFNYNNSDRYGDSLYQGVMSDEVPSNVVVVGKDGYDLVDYSKLDVEFKRVLI